MISELANERVCAHAQSRLTALDTAARWCGLRSTELLHWQSVCKASLCQLHLKNLSTNLKWYFK